MARRTDDIEDFDEDFESKYDEMFGEKKAKIDEYDRDVITGRRSKRPKMSVLNKSKISKQELDDLFM
jgi:hypothetical protein